jgi:hypothetical protein
MERRERKTVKINHPALAPNYYDQVAEIREGKRSQAVLLTGEEGSLANYKLGYGEGAGKEAWTTPRHRHNFEQVRHPLAGDYSILKDKVLPAGWVAYFPESAYYGPQIKNPNLTMLSLQFGGPSGCGYMSVRQRRQGAQELIDKGGQFEKGIYKWVDEQGNHHNQDAFEATWEQAMHTKMEYPAGRYDSLVMMNPANFDWVKDPDSKGVATKWLGTFTERAIKVGFIRLEPGADFMFGTEPAPEILFLKEGSIRHGDDIHEKLSAFGTTVADSPEPLTAVEESEFFYIKLPTF